MNDVILYNLSKGELQKAFDHAVSRARSNEVNNVIYIDNHTTDGSWQLANIYADKHIGLVTLARAHRKLPEREIKRFAFHLKDSRPFQNQGSIDGQKLPKIDGEPLVSITVHNYNYGRYLKECFESIMNQGYSNIEVLFSDNHSSDDSWGIALHYAEKYPDKFFIIKNRRNVGPGKNLHNCYKPMRGRLCIVLCSDDVLLPGCVQSCVDAFRANQDLGFVMFHRAIIDESGGRHEEAPFYDSTVKIPGLAQAAVYMLAAVNPSISQICYDRFKHPNLLKISLDTSEAHEYATENPLTRWWVARIDDFLVCLSHPVGYIHRPLLGHRVHGASDSTFTRRELLEIIGPYILNLYFAEISSSNPTITDRLAASKAKLASLSLRYAAMALLDDRPAICDQYFHLGQAIDPAIRNLDEFKFIKDFLEGRIQYHQARNHIRTTQGIVRRMTSYPPRLAARHCKCKVRFRGGRSPPPNM